MKKTLFLPNNKTEDDMNIRIGDIVRFISDKLEGKVTGIIDNNTVNVYCDEYGFEIPASVRSEEYYVKMMVAWFFATALAKQWDQAIPYIEQNRLAPWTHNKTIQKAIESYRITPEQKKYLRTLKIK